MGALTSATSTSKHKFGFLHVHIFSTSTCYLTEESLHATPRVYSTLTRGQSRRCNKEIARNYDKEIARKSTRPHSIAIKNLQERKTAALFRNEDTKRQDTAVSYYRISKMHPPSKSGIKASDPRTTHLTGLRDHHFKFLCVLLRRTGG